MKTLKQIKEDAVYERLKELEWHRGLTAVSLKVHPSKVYQYINALKERGFTIPKSRKRLSKNLVEHLPKTEKEKHVLPFNQTQSLA